MDTTQESAPVQPNNDISIDIDIHQETGLIVVEKIGIPDQGIELTVEDVEALSAFVKQHGDKLAHSSDFQESVKESANEPYEDSIKRALRAAHKAKNAEAVVYYNDCINNHRACASFERFKSSWAFNSWRQKEDVKKKIEQVEAEYKRFSWRNESNVNEADGTDNIDHHLYQELRRIGTTLNGQEKVNLLVRKYKINSDYAKRAVKGSSGYEHDLDENKEFDVESDDHWKDEKMIGFMKQKDVGHGHGTLRFKSNTGTTYTVELDKGKIISLKDHRGNVYDLPEIQQYWDKGFPLIGAIAATLGDPDSGEGEEEKMLLHSPEELQETDKEPMKEKLPRTRCERCGKPVNPGISSRLCPSCHENSLSDAESYYGVEEGKKKVRPEDEDEDEMEAKFLASKKGKEFLKKNPSDDNWRYTEPGRHREPTNGWNESVQEGGLHVDKGQQLEPSALSEEAPPGFPKSIYEKLVIKFKGDKKKINEVMWALHRKSKNEGQSLDEKAPPGFPKSLHDKLLNQYKDEPEKAYATMWKLHNEHGDKLESVVNEVSKKVGKKSTGNPAM